MAFADANDRDVAVARAIDVVWRQAQRRMAIAVNKAVAFEERPLLSERRQEANVVARHLGERLG